MTTLLCRLRQLGASTVLFALLAACGGGGSSDSTGSVEPLEAGSSGSDGLPAVVSLAAQQSISLPTAGSETESTTVVQLEKISETRVSRSTFDYIYRVTLRGGSKALVGAYARLTGVGSGSSIIDGMALIGNLGAGVSATGNDTVTIRHDRSLPFDPTRLSFATGGQRVAEIIAPVTTQLARQALSANVVEVPPAALAATNNPLVFIATSPEVIKVGQIFLRGGIGYRVTGLRKRADGVAELSTEQAPLSAIYDDLAFTSTFSLIPYNEDGSAARALSAPTRSRALAAGAVKRAGIDVASLPPSIKAAIAELQTCVEFGGEVSSNSARTKEPMHGYSLHVGCSLGELLGSENPALKAVTADLSLAYETLVKHHYDKAAKDDYLVQHKKTSVTGAIAVTSSVAQSEFLKETKHCKPDGIGVECTLTFFPLNGKFTVPGILIPGTWETGIVLKLRFLASGSTELQFGTETMHTTGLRAGIEVDEVADPADFGASGSVLPRGLSLEGSVEKKLHGAFGVEVGLKLDAVPGIDSALVSATGFGGIYGGFSRGMPDGLICMHTELGAELTGTITLFESKELGWEGIPLVSIPYVWPFKDTFSPSECKGVFPAGRVRIDARLNGAQYYRVQSAEGEVVELLASGNWLLDKQALATPEFTINLNSTLAINPAYPDKLFFAATLTDAPYGAGASITKVTGPKLAADGRQITIAPGSIKPGQMLEVAIEAWAAGFPVEASLTKRVLRIRFEQALAAAPTYRYEVDERGVESYRVDYQYASGVRELVRDGRVRMSDGDTYNVGISTFGQPDGSMVALADLSRTTNVEVREGLAVIPAELVLDSIGTAAPGTGGKAFRIVRNNDPAVEAVDVKSDPIVFGDRFSVEIRGNNLPANLEESIPGCGSKEEIFTPDMAVARAQAKLTRPDADLRSTTYRKFACVANKVGLDLQFTALSGLAIKTYSIYNDGSAPTMNAAPSSAKTGESVAFTLKGTSFEAQQAWALRVYEVIWVFGADIANIVVKAVDGWGDFFKPVYQAFVAAGEYVVKAIFYSATDLGAPLGKAETSVLITAAGGTRVDDVQPRIATAGVAQTFVVTGTNLTEGMSFALIDCASVTEVLVGGSATQRQFTCTFPAGTTPGSKDGAIAARGTGGSPFAIALLPFSVNVSASAEPKITAALVVTPNPAVVGDVITFVAQGVNLRGSGFQFKGMDYCGQPLAAPTTTTDTELRYSCTATAPTNLIGTVSVVAADAVSQKGSALIVRVNCPTGQTLDTSAGRCIAASGTIDLPAISFVRGENVALSANGYGADTLMNAPPYGSATNAAEWDFTVATAGDYELFAEYAALESRPVVIAFDGTVKFSNALSAVTGGWFPASRLVLSQGTVRLTAGTHTMRAARTAAFPHIKGFRLVLTAKTGLTVSSCGAPVTGVVFGEDFRADKLDPAKWSALNAAAGTVSVGGGRIAMSSGGSNFPSIKAIGNPFPVTGNFSYYCKTKYSSISGSWGAGACVASDLLDAENGVRSGGLGLWGGGNDQFLGFSPVGPYLTGGPSNSGMNFFNVQLAFDGLVHEYEFCAIGSTMTAYRDGQEVARSSIPTSWSRPKNLWLGNNVGVGSGKWGSFETYAIEVRTLQ